MNAFKSRLALGETLVGCWLNLGSPAATEALAHAGFDFLVIDAEHSAIDSMDMLSMLMAIGTRAAPLIRLADHQAAAIKRALDAGCPNLIFPGVESAQQARQLVAATRYPHPGEAGTRGVAGLVRAARYGLDRDYLQHANESVCVIAQIETAAGLAEVEAIAAEPGIDAVFIGPADLAACLGHLGDPAHAEVREATLRIQAAASAQGKPCGVFANDAWQARAALSAGLSLVALGADVIWLLKGARDALATMRQA